MTENTSAAKMRDFIETLPVTRVGLWSPATNEPEEPSRVVALTAGHEPPSRRPSLAQRVNAGNGTENERQRRGNCSGTEVVDGHRESAGHSGQRTVLPAGRRVNRAAIAIRSE